MHSQTGETISEELFNRLNEEERKNWIRLPDKISEDTVKKLQRPLTAQERRAFIKKLTKRRMKNKMAKKSRRRNR